MAYDGIECKRHRSFDWLNGNGSYLFPVTGDFTERNLTPL